MSLIKDLNDSIDTPQLAEAINTEPLTRSSFFKKIEAKDSKVADALKLLWGYKEFGAYVDKAQKKQGPAAHLDSETMDMLGKLNQLHQKLYPGLAPKKPVEHYKWGDYSHKDVGRKRGLETH